MSRIFLFSVGALLVAAQTPALRQGVSVQMPVTTSAVAVPDADRADSLVVAVTSRGAVFLEVTEVTPAQLSAKVKAEIEGHPGRRVYLKGDARTQYLTVAEVLGALRTAGVKAPILLTNQQDSTDASYVPPKGLEVLLSPPAPRATTLIIGSGQPSDTELNKHAQPDKPIVLEVDEKALFGDAVHAVDVCRAAGAKLYLATPQK